METLVSRPQIETEKQEAYRHFDVLSSVDLLRFDLSHEGSIRPETLQRVYDEELSYIAEGINRPLHTEFRLQQRDGKLSYFHNGQWTPYVVTLEKGLKAAYRERAVDFRKQILVDMAETDLKMYHQFNALKPGDRAVWYSAFNDEYHNLYGTEFMQDLGFQPKRRMGFMYEAIKNQDGSVTMKTQSVDNSDEAAFEAAMSAASEGANFKEILAVYDTVLGEKTGKTHYAGREAGGYAEEDAWEFIRKNSDLVDYFMQGITDLAKNSKLSRNELEKAKKRLTYGVWATVKARLDSYQTSTVLKSARFNSLQAEVNHNYLQLQTKGERLFGCGGSMGAEAGLMTAGAGEVFDGIFGEKSESKDSWGWKPGVCRVNECPTRPGKTQVGPCSVCKLCQGHFDKGRDPSSVYKRRRANAWLN